MARQTMLSSTGLTMKSSLLLTVTLYLWEASIYVCIPYVSQCSKSISFANCIFRLRAMGYQLWVLVSQPIRASTNIYIQPILSQMLILETWRTSSSQAKIITTPESLTLLTLATGIRINVRSSLFSHTRVPSTNGLCSGSNQELENGLVRCGPFYEWSNCI